MYFNALKMMGKKSDYYIAWIFLKCGYFMRNPCDS